MEVVELVEVIEGQEHHQVESFEDLILTVVPEGQEGTTVTTSGSGEGGQRTILVTEVCHDQQREDEKDEKIQNLEGRVEELENQVHFLEDELRLIRRKVKATSSNSNTNTHSMIRRTVMEILNKQTLKVSVSDYEDEEEYEPVGRLKGTPGRTPVPKATPAKRKFEENGISENEDEDEDFDDSEEEAEVVPKQRRASRGRPRGSGKVGRKPKVQRMELTPPPQKSSRPRGRPRKYADPVQEEEDVAEVVEPMETGKGKQAVNVERKSNVAEDVTTGEGDDDDDAENDDVKLTPGSQASPAKKGRRKAGADVEAEVNPTRSSTRMRRTSKKGSE